jgi:hypothetical protein
MYQVTNSTCTYVFVPVKRINKARSFHAIGLANEHIYSVTLMSHYMFLVYEVDNNVVGTELVRRGLSKLTSKLLCWSTLTNFARYCNKHWKSDLYLLPFRHCLQSVAKESQHSQCSNIAHLASKDFCANLRKYSR